MAKVIARRVGEEITLVTGAGEVVMVKFLDWGHSSQEIRLAVEAPETVRVWRGPYNGGTPPQKPKPWHLDRHHPDGDNRR